MTTTTIRGRHRRSFWLGFRPVAVALALLLALAVLTACGSTTPTAVADEPELTPIEQAAECGNVGIDVYDDGETLIVDHKGDEDTSGASIDQVACVLLALGAPMSVAAKLDNTRALDGTQSASWDGFAATWSYHPDTGLDLIVEAQR